MLLILAIIMAGSLSVSAQHFADEVFFDARTELADGPAFQVDLFNFHALGHLSETVSYRIRHRIAKTPFSDAYPLNSTDFLWIDWAPDDKWELTGGKIPVFLGGYEWDDAPIDVYFWNGFCNHVWQVYSLGVQAARHFSPGQTILLQVINSPWSMGESNCFAGNLGWQGQFAPWWNTLWSVNWMDDYKRRGMGYLSLGNRFESGDWALEFDLMDRESFRRGQRFFSDWSVTLRAVLEKERYHLFLKGGYDRNVLENEDESGPYDVILPPGTEYAVLGGGIEWFPLPFRDKLRLHAVLWQDNLSRSPHFSLGATFRLDILRKTHESSNNGL